MTKLPLSPGRLLYLLYHRPVASFNKLINDGGPLEHYRTRSGERAMIAAAAALPLPVGDQTTSALEIHLLTGNRFWHQTAFCLWTFAHQSGRCLAPVIYDDGTLAGAERDHLRRLFPAIHFVPKADSAAALDAMLPASRYPFLHDRWRLYPNIRKLIDPHLGSSGWKLVLDSDLLFFRRPDFLLSWLAAPDRPLHAVDNETSYGYGRALMDRLAGAHVGDLINVGLTGLRSDELDWERVEYFCRELITASGTHYFLEQALIAMLVAGRDCAVAPAADYVTCPVPPEAGACRAVMHHYVAHSKPWYFRQNWRTALTLPLHPPSILHPQPPTPTPIPSPSSIID